MNASRPRHPRRLRVALWIAVSVVLVAAFAVGLRGRSWIAHAIAVAPNAGKALRPEDDPSPADVLRAGADEQLRVELPAPDGVSLAVWIAEPARAPRGTVLVLHGIRSEKQWMMGFARGVAAAGFRAVVPDLRGHGRSSGSWLSYGVHEARDLSQLLNELTRSKRLVEPVGVLGVSYGAATGIQLAGRDARVRAVVAVAPFRSLDAVVPNYVQNYLPVVWRLIPQHLVSAGIHDAGVLGGFEPKDASPELWILRTRAQVLLIHGTRDAHIPAEHSRRLCAAAPDHSELVLVEGEDHFSIANDRTGTIAKRGVEWFTRWLAPPEASAR